MDEVKILNGGMNLDDSPESMGKAEYSKAFNYRSSGTDEQEANYGTNLESTTQVTSGGQRPSGVNTAVGTGKFKKVKKAYTVYYNSSGRHQLVEMDYATLKETVIFEDRTNTGGVNVFDIKPDTFFNDIKLMHDTYLLMTDGASGMIYCINIERLKNGGYVLPITKDSFNLLKSQPLIPIKAEYADDSTKNANLMKGKLFQFRSQYEYDDYAKSVWSTISKRPVPEMEMTDAIGDDPTKLNAIQLKVNIGDALVKKITIAVRSGIYNWYIARTVERSRVLALTNTTLDLPNEVREAYNPVTNEYIFTFYNDGALEPVDVLETDEPYDAIPRNAGTLEIVNGNILAVGDLDEGYERPSNLKVALSSSGYLPDLDSSVEGRNPLTSSSSETRPAQSSQRIITIDFYGQPKSGDRILIKTRRLGESTGTDNIVFDVPPSADENMNNFIEGLFNLLPSREFDNFPQAGFPKNKTRQTFDNNHGRVSFWTVGGSSREELDSIRIIPNATGSVEGLTKGSVKSNTSYQLALAHYDKFGRYFPIVTDENYVITTPSYAITQGLIPQIGWTLQGTPPPEAVSYQWLISENTKYLRNLYATAIYDADESKEDFLVLNLVFLGRYATSAEGAVVNYEFSQGDRVTFVNNFDGDNAKPIKWFNNPPLDFPVSDFEIKSYDDGGVTRTKYLLKLKKSTLINTGTDLAGKEVLLEIYTPKKNNEALESKVFYEIGEQFNIVNGEYSVKSGAIKEADAYIRPRKFISNKTDSVEVYAITVEDFNFSDSYESKFWSSGRGRSYNDELGKVKRPASIRYSDTFAFGTRVNNLNRFYGARLYGDADSETTSVHGAITKLIMRQTYLIALQEFNVGHIPVNRAIIESADAQQSLAISDKLFNNVTYIGNVGTGMAKKAIAVSETGVVYFVDVNNGYPCRDGYDGVSIINTKMTKYFSKKLKGANPKSLVSYFDDFNQEWNVTFTELSEEVKAFAYNELNYEYKDNFEKGIEDVLLIQPEHGILSVNGENLKYTPTAGYTGEDRVGLTFTDGDQVITKFACGTIEDARTTVTQFSFIDVYGQDLSTLTESNAVIASDIDIPVPISVSSGGEYSKDGGTTWESVNGMVSPDTAVIVRTLSANVYGGSKSVTLTMGSTSATFKVFNKFGNIAMNQDFTRECPEGQTGSVVNYNVPVNTFFGKTQQEANAKAAKDIEDKGQAFANDPENGGTCTVNYVFVWGKIVNEDIETEGLVTWANIRLRTYRGNSLTEPPTGTLVPETCTNPSIAISYNQSADNVPNNFNVSMSNQNVVTLVPPNTASGNSKYPKQYIAFNSGGSLTLWCAFTGKAEGEWALLQTKSV